MHYYCVIKFLCYLFYYSYAIACFNVSGESPYPGVKSRQIAGLLQTGYRMPRPAHISQEL